MAIAFTFSIHFKHRNMLMFVMIHSWWKWSTCYCDKRGLARGYKGRYVANIPLGFNSDLDEFCWDIRFRVTWWPARASLVYLIGVPSAVSRLLECIPPPMTRLFFCASDKLFDSWPLTSRNWSSVDARVSLLGAPAKSLGFLLLKQQPMIAIDA